VGRGEKGRFSDARRGPALASTGAPCPPTVARVALFVDTAPGASWTLVGAHGGDTAPRCCCGWAKRLFAFAVLANTAAVTPRVVGPRTSWTATF